MSIVIPQSTYEPIAPGIYTGKITQIEAQDGQFGPQLKFTFQLDPFEGYEAGKQQHAWCSQKFNAKTKLYAWTQAVLGKLPPDYAFDSDDLIDKQVTLVIGNRYSGDGNQLFDFVESVKPRQQKRNPEPVQHELGVSSAIPN